MFSFMALCGWVFFVLVPALEYLIVIGIWTGVFLFPPEKVREIQEKLEAFIEALHQEK